MGAFQSRVVESVPFVHVADVEASLNFYALLGFVAQNHMRDDVGRMYWASTSAGERARIMFALASAPIDPSAQAVLFYMYAPDVSAVRERLLEAGVPDGGVYCGQPLPPGDLRAVFEVTRPPYMPDGQLRLHDPDGYCILVGQRAD